MVIDLTAVFMEIRRRRIWVQARVVRTIDPSGLQFRADEWGRLMRFEDYEQTSVFGWVSVLIDLVEYPVNFRTIADIPVPAPSFSNFQLGV